jgi:predicted nucleic acid-binding protein
MPYLIDTDWTIDHLGEDPAAVALLTQLTQDGIAISMVTYMEVWEGIIRDPAPHEAQARFARFLLGVPVLPFSQEVAQRCARLRHDLRIAGRRVNARALDLVNAATALHYGLTFVTRNVADYQDVPGLMLYRPR